MFLFQLFNKCTFKQINKSVFFNYFYCYFITYNFTKELFKKYFKPLTNKKYYDSKLSSMKKKRQLK